jgi:hypothetical protein
MNIPSPKIRLAIVRHALEHPSDLWACAPVPKKSSSQLHKTWKGIIS